MVSGSGQGSASRIAGLMRVGRYLLQEVMLRSTRYQRELPDIISGQLGKIDKL
jgi:hypothetical protein